MEKLNKITVSNGPNDNFLFEINRLNDGKEILKGNINSEGIVEILNHSYSKGMLEVIKSSVEDVFDTDGKLNGYENISTLEITYALTFLKYYEVKDYTKKERKGS